ncbi:tRNA glutamyl-Q(34) synthetase GluQRS [Marinicella meishanensis]|uniref:tRNA glutamyl-Q(34) synthetase GluQRS n=1 Tax=Marinicella meishanensis TaxID=2873263 RepID=UPI001CBDA7B0|nr:tRNA glutamyl-Q(34) synthetase GluQRS [Marinicella sp. NBU2979]
MSQAPYRGRFAPSPTGDLHLGSLVAAVASYCQARAHDGVWLVRMEDLDETRTVSGADQQILNTLARCGMYSDEPVMYQTQADRQAAYQQAHNALRSKGLTYHCVCSRKQLADQAVYPGTCRQRTTRTDTLYSIRLQTTDEVIQFDDGMQGNQQQNLATQVGDFNIKRKDGLFAYQLAVVVDDAAQGITEVVRGIDIMDSTCRQIYLQRLLDLPSPKYAHFPVITDAHDHKLSKQNHAPAITEEDPFTVLRLALHLLQQAVPTPQRRTPKALLEAAIKHWQPDRLRGLAAVPQSAIEAND